ncbi:MAG: c-type cytochrome biogenesis protein CcsB [Candidatus Omnitrophica bacterium]|nr:c-type cytochrome biogenesis protein CcsB [Candidatus Omnitrophota bacterium]
MIVGILILAYLFFSIASFLAFASEKKWLLGFSLLLGVIILMFHGAVVLDRGLKAGHWPFTNTYETLILMSFLVMGIYFLTFRRYKIAALGGFGGLIVSAILALTSLLSPEIEPLLPALKSNWLLFHVVSAFIGYSSFALASASALVYLSASFFPLKAFKKNEDPEKISQFLDYVNWLLYRFIAAGFAFLTLGICAGSVWANASWGRYWNWDPKETWAFVTWLIFAVCLHMKSNGKYQGRLVAFMTLVGFATVMFTYFGVNFWLASLHAYG